MKPIDANSINGHVERLCRRQRRLNAIDMMVRGLLIGGIIATIVVIIALFSRDAASAVAGQALLLIPVAGALGGLIGFILPVNRLRLARALDRASAGEDRFASALELAHHHRPERARLVIDDAMRIAQGVSAESALPLRMPRSLKFVPLPAAALALAFWLAPNRSLDAKTVEPEVAADEWQQLHEEFRQELADLPEAVKPEDQELSKRLEQLAQLLKENPQKKEVLEQIARTRSEIEKRRKALPGGGKSMRSAAAGVRSSAALKPMAFEMRQGEYRKAAEELAKLAKKLRENAESMSAEDFEAAAGDLDRMATEMEAHEELGKACKNCANAASSMDRDKLANALERLSRELNKNCDKLSECDRLCRQCNALDALKNRLNKCKSGQCKDGSCNGKGCSSCNSMVKRSNKKGGSKAGWGTADKWDGGQMAKRAEQRTPNLAAPREQAGSSTSFKVTSRDEKADSAMPYKDMYADFVQKAEADLALESAPLAYREYLRKYFIAIKPQETGGPATPEK